MRIALVSTGLGHVLRGFESFTDSLFQVLRRRAPEIDVTLFQGGGQPAERRVVVPNFHRNAAPARWYGPLTASHWEKRSFALALYPRLRLGNFDLVHYNELTMGSALFHLRRLLGGRYRLLYCNGAPSPPVQYHHRCDYAQLLTAPDHREALDFGIPAARLFPIPYGVDANRFHPDRKATRALVRQELGIPAQAPVVLSVAAIAQDHKRVDHLIREVGTLGDEVHLLVAGQRTAETAMLEGLADRVIPGRWRFVSEPHDRVASLYGAADVFVLCSMTEAFGLVSVEAMLSEIPVVIHNGPVFRWLAEGTATATIDMGSRGALREALQSALEARGTSGQRAALGRARDVALRRFGWEALLNQYVEMYRCVCSGERS